jgi:hypothetical protein
MAKRSERHVRKVKETLHTPAARPAHERALAVSSPDGPKRGSASQAAALAGYASSVPSALGGSTTPDATGQVGTPGNLNVFGFLTGEDYNPDLDGYPMFPNYNKMRLGDAQVNATLLMLKLPLKGATWIAKPASDDAQDQAIADFVQANLIDDDSLARSWQHVLDNAMLKFDFGCAASEVIWGLADESPTALSRLGQAIELGRYGPKGLEKYEAMVHLDEMVNGPQYSRVVDLAPRLPRTFYRWIEDPTTGKLAFLQQFAPKHGQYGFWNIPAANLALHVRAREGNNYYGRSVLRTSYPHWWWKQQLYRIDMIGHDRFHVGIPRAKLTADYQAGTAPLDKLEATLKGLRSHDRAYMVQPFGVEYDIYGARDSAGGGTSGILQSIEHHNLMIARNILQSFAAQGEQRHGSFGAAHVTSEAYFKALEGESQEIGSELKQAVVKRLCDLNFDMRGRKYPQIACSDITAVDFSQLAAALGVLAEKGIVTPDDDLEAWVRDLIDAPGLPDALKGLPRGRATTTPPPGQPGGPDPAAGDDPPPVVDEPIDAARRTPFLEGGRAFSRAPSALERRVFDLHGIPDALDRAHGHLVHALATIRREQLKVVAARVAQKDGRKTAPFTDIRHAHVKMPQVDALVKTIRAAQTEVFAYGRKSVRTELQQQGARLPQELAANDTSAGSRRGATSHLVSSATITARRQADSWLSRILDEALRLRRTGLRGEELVSAIIDALEDEAESGARRDANAEINEAFGLGRALSAQELRELVDHATYSAILDANTCEPCQELDGEEFEIDSPEYEANLPPNANCDGKDLCRCVYLYVAHGDAQESA